MFYSEANSTLAAVSATESERTGMNRACVSARLFEDISMREWPLLHKFYSVEPDEFFDRGEIPT